ncbi:AQP8 [Mytilus edulis]|uniref:AQP8 n=1 Tax=Mytilus edulis TaxID=6550 RepID=A0A8S3QB29_MYTED|nr:AQP8 [Mytilus edulis]
MNTDIYLRNRDLGQAPDRQGTEEIDVHNGTEHIQSDETTGKWSISNNTKELLRAIFVEFIGTLFYVFIATNGYWYGPGFVLTSLMIAFGKISEGHFNPVITLAVSISRGFTRMTALYVIAQMVGGIAGAALAKVVFFDYSNAVRLGPYLNVLGESVEPANGILCEGLSTFLLVLTYLMSIVDKRNKDSMLSPIAIGCVVTANIVTTLNVTGGSMNPARSFGPVVCLSNSKYSHVVWKYHYVYWVGPTAGSIVAAVVYRFILSTEPCCCRTQ